MGLSASSRFVFPANAGNMSKREKFKTPKFNSSINYLLSELNQLDGELGGSQKLMNFCGVPYVSDTTKIAVPGILCRDSTNQYWMYNPNVVTARCDYGNQGPGDICSSGNLSGTISTTNGSNVVAGTGTKFLTDLVVGDLLSANAGTIASVITAITSDTSLTIMSTQTASVSNVQYNRGVTGSVALATGLKTSEITGFWVYVISNGATTKLALSRRNVATGQTLVDLPSGYTRYRQLGLYFCFSSATWIVPFQVVSGWPFNPTVRYLNTVSGSGDIENTSYGFVCANASSAASGTVSIHPYLPKNASSVYLRAYASCASGTNELDLYGYPSSSTGSFKMVHRYPTAGGGAFLELPLLPLYGSTPPGPAQFNWANLGTTPVTTLVMYGYSLQVNW